MDSTPRTSRTDRRLVTPQRRSFEGAAAARVRRLAVELRARLRDVRHAKRGAVERGADLSCAERVASRGRHPPARRRLGRRRLVGQHGRARQAGRHRSLLRRRRQQRRLVLRLDRPGVDRPFDRSAVRRVVPGRDRRGLGRRAGATRRRARHRALRGRDGRLARRHAGARLGDALSVPHRALRRDRVDREAVGAEHRVQRRRTPGDPDRPRLSRRRLLRAWRRAEKRAARRADDRPHHLPVRRRHGREIRARA